ncbi:MAG: universal stress protein [Roseiflexaceae bacterium]|nr:universal stress protein [Roseiflexaceae bacterium]
MSIDSIAKSPRTKGYVVLLPVIDHDEARRLLPLAAALADHQRGRVVALGAIVVPPDAPLGGTVPESRKLRAELDATFDLDGPSGESFSSTVNVGHSLAEAIRRAAAEQRASVILLGWQGDRSSSERMFGPPIDDLLRQPPCDVIVARLSTDTNWRRVLLPVRGGPHTTLACETALALAERHDAAITMLYASDPRLTDSLAVRESLQSLRTLPRVSRWLERTIPAEQAILAEAPEHQVIVLGVTGRPNDPELPTGPLADRVLRHADATVVLVRHRMEQAEEQAQQVWERQRDLSTTVDRWFAENTFSSAEFEDLKRLTALKQQQKLTISLGLPALNEEETIGQILGVIKRTMMDEVPLLDEIVLIDSRSTDRTVAIAEELGIPVRVHQDILPQYGSFVGKGEALWKSLFVLKGDIVAWVDTDIKNFHPRFVYGIIGPLLREPNLVYCKGFYRRPIQMGETLAATGGGRVTELTARPLLNLFYPELSGMIQPLSGEYAG